MKLETDCYECKHRRSIPGNAHIQCVNPDPLMQANRIAVRNGWFFYPLNFDPVWRQAECANFEQEPKA